MTKSIIQVTDIPTRARKAASGERLSQLEDALLLGEGEAIALTFDSKADSKRVYEALRINRWRKRERFSGIQISNIGNQVFISKQ